MPGDAFLVPKPLKLSPPFCQGLVCVHKTFLYTMFKTTLCFYTTLLVLVHVCSGNSVGDQLMEVIRCMRPTQDTQSFVMYSIPGGIMDGQLREMSWSPERAPGVFTREQLESMGEVYITPFGGFVATSDSRRYIIADFDKRSHCSYV